MFDASFTASTPLSFFFPSFICPLIMADTVTKQPSNLGMYDKQRDEMFSMLLKASDTDEGWSSVKESGGVKVSSQDCSKTGLKKCRSVGIAQATMEEVLFLLVDKECFKKVDKQARKFELLESIDDDHKVMYSHYKGMYTVADRDFVYFRAKKDLEGGKRLLYATFSVDTHEVEPVKGVVRAWIHFSGWCIEAIERPEDSHIKASGLNPKSEGPWLKVTYAAQVDPKGWIPTFVINSLVGEASQVVIRFRENLVVAREMLQDRKAEI